MHPTNRFVMATTRWLLPLLALLLASSCVHKNFTPTGALSMPPRPDNCYLDIILDGKPEFAYVVIGRVSTDATSGGVFAWGENESDAVRRLKEAACDAGAHILFGMETGSQGQWNDDGFSKATRGTAVAAVYVDPQGRPLPPPTGPMHNVKLPTRPTQ